MVVRAAGSEGWLLALRLSTMERVASITSRPSAARLLMLSPKASTSPVTLPGISTPPVSMITRGRWVHSSSPPHWQMAPGWRAVRCWWTRWLASSDCQTLAKQAVTAIRHMAAIPAMRYFIKRLPFWDWSTGGLSRRGPGAEDQLLTSSFCTTRLQYSTPSTP